MTISRLSTQAGVGVETVRFYQRRGLMQEPVLPSTGGSRGVRRYGDEDLRQLRFIRSAQKAGFTLDQIGQLMKLDANGDRVEARSLAIEQIGVLDKKIAELTRARHALARLASECSASLEGPCPILQAFDPD